MTETALDVLAIGNAIVDVIASADDAFITRENLVKGGMTLIDAEQATALYGKMNAGREISGGSAANTLAGLAALGARCAFIGQVANDQLGEVFAHDVRAGGIEFDSKPSEGEPPTARCLILVTPDGQRTMNTFLGASQFLPATAIDEDAISKASILYLEGYLWDPEEPRAAMRRAIAAAKGAGREVAFTLSDAFVIDRHRADFLQMIDEGKIDILFANEIEIKSLNETDVFEQAVAATAAKVPLLIVTQGEHGAIALSGGERHSVDARPTDVVDTTGAGDLFAAGFLAGRVKGESISRCLDMGAIAAAEIISHFGARAEKSLQALMDEKLG